jgi:hypothetical protein
VEVEKIRRGYAEVAISRAKSLERLRGLVGDDSFLVRFADILLNKALRGIRDPVGSFNVGHHRELERRQWELDNPDKEAQWL